jgi:16S rRNA (uracil1498-N3)-methyltransferase
MPHLHRFYIGPIPESRSLVDLPEHEAHHALHVLRLGQGDEVALFDGCGTEFTGTVSKTTRHDVSVEIHRHLKHVASNSTLCILQAWLHRNESIEDLVRRGTEIGVREFVFFRGKHSERAPKPNEKWTRWAIESCKQCGRFWLPQFSVVADLDAALRTVRGNLLIATPHRPPTPLKHAISKPSISILIGPEGDLDPTEIDAAIAAGGIPVSLGAATYRAEVAAVLLASLIQYELGELEGNFSNPPGTQPSPKVSK